MNTHILQYKCVWQLNDVLQTYICMKSPVYTLNRNSQTDILKSNQCELSTFIFQYKRSLYTHAIIYLLQMCISMKNTSVYWLWKQQTFEKHLKSNRFKASSYRITKRISCQYVPIFNAPTKHNIK